MRRPAHAYTFSFAPNPDWSSFYAYGPEIKKYMQDFAQKYDLLPYISLNSKVLKAQWIEEKGICKSPMVEDCVKPNADLVRPLSVDEVQVDVNGTVIDDWCHVLVNGTGFLNSWKCKQTKDLPIKPSEQWRCLQGFTGPTIPGLHSFGGKLLHSASWDSCKSS